MIKKIVKIILTILIIKFIKVLSFIFIITLILINNESNKILNKNEGFYIKPYKTLNLPEKITNLTLIYAYFYNKIFDLTYIKIKIGPKNFWIKIIKKIKIKKIIERLFLIIIGISKLAINLIKEIWTIESFEEYMFKKTYNSEDNRLIIKMNNEWLINGNVSSKLVKKSPKSIEKKITEWEKLQEGKEERFIELKAFKSPEIKGIHYGTNYILKDKNKIAYFTDYKKSIKNNDYGNMMLIEKANFKKETKILIKEDNFNTLEKNTFVEENRIILGAIGYGYNENMMDEYLNEKIKNEEEILKIIEKDLIELGIGEKSINKELILKAKGNILSDEELKIIENIIKDHK